MNDNSTDTKDKKQLTEDQKELLEKQRKIKKNIVTSHSIIRKKNENT